MIAPSARAALAGYLHGKPPPLPRRGPLARLRRGEEAPQLADVSVMHESMGGRPQLASVGNAEAVSPPERAVDPVAFLRELASAWKRLARASD